MYKKAKYSETSLEGIEVIEGETIEFKVERIVNNKEPIKDGAPQIFTERKDGVISAYNIRADRWEIATDAMDKVQKSMMAKREEKAGETTEPKKGKVVEIGEAKTIQDTTGATE
jgi:hypothetical protein